MPGINDLLSNPQILSLLMNLGGGFLRAGSPGNTSPGEILGQTLQGLPEQMQAIQFRQTQMQEHQRKLQEEAEKQRQQQALLSGLSGLQGGRPENRDLSALLVQNPLAGESAIGPLLQSILKPGVDPAEMLGLRRQGLDLQERGLQFRQQEAEKNRAFRQQQAETLNPYQKESLALQRERLSKPRNVTLDALQRMQDQRSQLEGQLNALPEEDPERADTQRRMDEISKRISKLTERAPSLLEQLMDSGVVPGLEKPKLKPKPKGSGTEADPFIVSSPTDAMELPKDSIYKGPDGILRKR
jgi:hypothetical protein